MNELAKWAWLLLLAILWIGHWIFVILAIDVVAFILIAWLKPEWLDKL
jgi:hypothetical protein